MSEASVNARSSSWVRHAAPVGVLAFALALSAFARTSAAGPKLGLMPTPLALWLLPAVSLLVFAGVRLSSGRTDRNSDLLLLWVASFPLMLHVLHLLYGLGALQNLDRAVSIGVVALHLGFAGLMPSLPHGSAFGLRFTRTLESQAAWRRTHRQLGLGFLVAAVGALTTLWLSPRAALFVYLGGPVLALGFGLAGAFSGAREDSIPGPRPSPGEETPEDTESSP